MAILASQLIFGATSGPGRIGALADVLAPSGWRLASAASRAAPVETADQLPTRADAVVIRAGIAGIATALFLNEKGLNTVVLEKGVAAGEQSSRAFEWIYSNGWDPGKLELANHSKRIWSSLSTRFGMDVGYRASGNFVLLDTDNDIDQQKEWLIKAHQVDARIDARLLYGSELDSFFPNAGRRFKAALYQASDGSAEPTYSVSRIAMGAIREGVRIVAPCAARSIDREAGKVVGIHTEKGYIRVAHVILAGGVWSGLFAGNLDVRVPQLGVIALPGAGFGSDVSWRRHKDGLTTIGAAGVIAPITKDSFRYVFDFLPTLRTAAGLVRVRLGKDMLSSLWASQNGGR